MAVAADDRRRTVTVPQAAAILGVGVGTAYRAAARGDLPVVKVGGRVLISLPALEAMLQASTPTGEAR